MLQGAELEKVPEQCEIYWVYNTEQWRLSGTELEVNEIVQAGWRR